MLNATIPDQERGRWAGGGRLPASRAVVEILLVNMDRQIVDAYESLPVESEHPATSRPTDQ